MAGEIIEIGAANNAVHQFEGDAKSLSLEKAKPSPVSLSAKTWEPQAAGELIRGYIIGIRDDGTVRDGSSVQMPHVFILVPQVNGELVTMRNGNKVLVSTVKNAIETGVIIPNCNKTPVEIVFDGKVRNKTNSYSSNSFKIRILQR